MTDVPPHLPRSDDQRPRFALAWLAALCLASCFLMMPIVSVQPGPPSVLGAVCVFGALGCVLAQGNLLAAWLVWGCGRFLWRLTRHWIVAAGLCMVWLLGAWLAMPLDVFREMAPVVALSVPLVSLAAQLPLWILRYFCGWRLVRDNEAPVSVEPPLTIRDLMMATLLVAVAFGVARLSPLGQREERWIAWGIASLMTSFISTIAMLPAGVLLLRMSDRRRGHIYSGLYVTLWIVFQWSTLFVIRFYAPAAAPPLFLNVGVSVLMLAFAGTLTLTATVARTFGYRLVGRQSPSLR